MNKKGGRPTRDPAGKPSKLFPVRLTDAERMEYEQAAQRAELSVSEWIRDRLAKAAKRESRRN